MPKTDKHEAAQASGTKRLKAEREIKFSSFEDFETKMLPKAVAQRSLREDGPAARALGERLAEALAEDAARRLSSRGQ